MADPSSSDRPGDPSAIDGPPHQPLAPVGAPPEREPGLPGADQTLADADQTLTDADQTLADADQTGAERDQASSDRDQSAADRDQAVSDRGLGHGLDRLEHELSRDMRLRSAREREQTAAARLSTAGERDAGARARDLVATVRDRAADARDRAMAQLDAVYATEPRRRPGPEAASPLTASGQRRRAAEHRARAAEHRELAARDREAAAQDREQAAADRSQALADREALARQLELAEIDPLTGALTRAAGLMDLEHELDRCRRTTVRLVVAYVDVVGLKKLNDSAGHAAGDDLLRRVVTLMEANLRSYDLIIRVGGDEFLSVMSSMTLVEARRRFERVAAAVAASPGGGGIRTGFAELESTDTAADLMARADTELIARHA